MNRTEALEHFRSTYIEVLIKEYIGKLEELFNDQVNELSVLFIDSFRRICLSAKAMQERGEMGKIGYIVYSMRRTYLIEQRYEYVIEAFDRDWFFDQRTCQDIYDAGWAFEYWGQLGSMLEQQRKRYMNVIISPDIEQSLLYTVDVFHDFIIRLAVYAIQRATELPEFLALDREDDLEIRVGEYKGLSKLIFKGEKASIIQDEDEALIDIC
ncbi:hypothetical protein [Paenibacillus polymyxa]|uniref:hypothetical protein n=1 Tax=Paenibacillus polymyxa TaxID=1406 RepID=UPI001C9DBB20|nr:hypothetical protein [Paenibacillus polymyxa]MBY7740201.1 hypothetical protein [Paenibacillus polymyxa]